MLPSMRSRLTVLFAAFILDLIFGDPKGMPHVVVYIGKLIKYSEDLLTRLFKPAGGEEEDRGLKLMLGALLFFIVTGTGVLITVLILYAAGRIGRYPEYGISVFLCFQLLAVKSLFSEAMKVYRALKDNDIKGARLCVSMIVGRDTGKLDEKGIIRAAVETVAENTSDGIIAPIFYMVLFGLPGMVFYKAVNTLDSMVGYRNEKYMYLGRFSARMDDVMNFIPARLTGLIMVMAAGLTGHDAGSAMRIFLRDRKNHPSPNSAHGEAAMAGALKIRLGGEASYFGRVHKKPFIGDDTKEPVSEDIREACRIMLTTAVLGWLIGLLVLLFMGK